MIVTFSKNESEELFKYTVNYFKKQKLIILLQSTVNIIQQVICQKIPIQNSFPINSFEHRTTRQESVNK